MKKQEFSERETMSDGFDAAPYTKGGSSKRTAAKQPPAMTGKDDESEDNLLDSMGVAGEKSPDDEAVSSVYDMFCELNPEEQSAVMEMIEKKHRDGTKRALRATDNDEFQPMQREDR